MKVTELEFEVQSGNDIIDMFGEEFCLSVGSSDKESDISIDDIDHDEFISLFEEACENVFLLSDNGKLKFKTKQSIIDWCVSIGMILD